MIKNPDFLQKFELFIQNICKMSDVEEKFIQEHIVSGIRNWELEEQQNINIFFSIKGRKKTKQIQRLTKYIKEALSPYVESNTKLEDIIECVEIGLEGMFNDSPSLVS